MYYFCQNYVLCGKYCSLKLEACGEDHRCFKRRYSREKIHVTRHIMMIIIIIIIEGILEDIKINFEHRVKHKE